MKKIVVTASVVGLVLATAACSVKAPSPDKYIDQAKSAAAQASDAAKAEAGDGAGDPSAAICADQGTPGTQALGMELQILAQLSLSVVQDLRGDGGLYGGLVNTEATRSGIADYRVLDGHGATGFHDPKEILDKYADLNDRLEGLVTSATEPTQADIDAFNVVAGDPGALIYTQLDIAMAMDTYCNA